MPPTLTLTHQIKRPCLHVSCLLYSFIPKMQRMQMSPKQCFNNRYNTCLIGWGTRLFLCKHLTLFKTVTPWRRSPPIDRNPFGTNPIFKYSLLYKPLFYKRIWQNLFYTNRIHTNRIHTKLNRIHTNRIHTNRIHTKDCNAKSLYFAPFGF